jgi:hypothetical protein
LLQVAQEMMRHSYMAEPYLDMLREAQLQAQGLQLRGQQYHRVLQEEAATVGFHRSLLVVHLQALILLQPDYCESQL